MHQPKAGGRLSANSATSFNTKISIAKSNRRYKVIVRIGCRVVVASFILNCMHMQAVVHAMQAVTKTALLQQQWIIISPLGGMQLLKQLQTSS